MSLTNEDKDWIAGHLGQLDAKIGQLDTRIERLDARFGTEIARLEAKVSTEIARLDVKIDQVDAKIERVETTLLTEFHKWASPVDLRLKSHKAVMRTFDIELEALTERVTNLEPPPQLS